MTQNTTLHYTPTFMEKLLGGNYKWWYAILYYVKLRTTYRIDNFLYALGSTVVLFGTVLTWWLALGKTFSSELSERLTYFIIGTLIFSIINTWPSFFGFEIKRGSHTALLLKPSSVLGQIFAKYFGVAIFQNLNMGLIILALTPVWINHVSIQPAGINLFLVVLISSLAIPIYFLLELIVGLMAFFITEINGLILNWGFVANLLMGKLFPLNLLISNFTILLFNPLAFTFYHPMQIYLGNYDTNQTLLVFAGGIIWCVVLYFLTKLIFKLGLKRNESVGL